MVIEAKEFIYFLWFVMCRELRVKKEFLVLGFLFFFFLQLENDLALH